ncbi:MAG: DUF2256 and DUF3253 domain-containing protein [Gammaproteobacteria bacterium]|nr:DUF2256 and DUF3253 domain-containing protein [Gammaproteobacteria bacterium]NNM00461.1 DUF2256 and DUF3253 domain-containing protein [Gammaproteobacteria bacterium]
MSRAELKYCATCGREIEWRRKWARNWGSVRYCSDACRRKRRTGQDERLESLILELLARRAAGATICPSEAARRLAGESGIEDWRKLLEPTRRAARRLHNEGRLEFLQRGRTVNPSRARGPVRLRLAGGTRP